MSGSSIPDAIDGLVAAFTTVNLPGFDVFDGPAFDQEQDFLSIGWADAANTSPSASGTSQVADFGMSEGLETYDVLHLLRTWVGDEENLGDARRRIFGYFTQFRAALASDYSLGGVVMQSWIGTFELTPFLTANGGYLDLVFTVTCRAAR